MGRPGLTKHRKFLRLERLLGSHALARGVLETVWDVCNENGDDILGDSFDVEAIARWNGDPGALTKHLLDAGFIEEHPEIESTYRVHDFWHHAPEYVPNRKARETERRKDKVCAYCGNPYHSPDTRSQYCSKACKTAAWRHKGSVTVTDCDQYFGHGDGDVTDCDHTPITHHPSPPTVKTTPCSPPQAGDTGKAGAKGSRAAKRAVKMQGLPLEARSYFDFSWLTFPTDYKNAEGKSRNLRLNEIKVVKLWVAILDGAMSGLLRGGIPATAEELACAAQLYLSFHPQVKKGYASEIGVFFSISDKVDSNNLWAESVNKVRDMRAEGRIDEARPWDGQPPMRPKGAPQPSAPPLPLDPEPQSATV